MGPPIWFLSVPLGFLNGLYPRFIAAVLTAKLGVQLDNVNPREQVEGSELAMKDSKGYLRRAMAAHNNGWEAMIIWVAAVALARVTDVDTDDMNTVAAVWLAARVLYNPAYILVTDLRLSLIRSILFAVSLTCAIILFVLGALEA